MVAADKLSTQILATSYPFDRGDRVKKVKNLVDGENPYSVVTDINQHSIQTDAGSDYFPNSDFVAAPPTTEELLKQLDGFVPTPEQAELLKNQKIYSIFDYLRHQASGEWVSKYVLAIELNFTMPLIQHFLEKMEQKLIQKHETHDDTQWRLLIPPSAQTISEQAVSGKELIIDPEFKSLIPPSSSEERSQLEANLLAEGCRDPLVIWKGHNILLDGYNRYDICTLHGIQFKTVEIELPDRDAARDWLIRNQLGRRNLTPEAISYLRGKRYNLEKTSGHGAKSGRQNVTQNSGRQNVVQLDTAERLATEYKVTGRTIQRDAQYAEAVDTLVDVVGEDVRPSILSRDAKLTKKQTLELARQAKNNTDAVLQKFKPDVVTSKERSQPISIKPFPYKVGEVCRVIPKDEPQLRGRGGCWAIVSEVYDFSCDIQLWNGKAESIRSEYLVSLEYTPEQCQQRQKLSARIARLRSYNLDPDAYSILSNLGKQKNPELRPWQEKLLSFLEQQYGLKDISQHEDVTAKVEVNTNDILMAFARQLGGLNNRELKFVGKAIGYQPSERVEEVVSAIGISSKEQAVEIVKSIVLVYPEAIRQLLEED